MLRAKVQKTTEDLLDAADRVLVVYESSGAQIYYEATPHHPLSRGGSHPHQGDAEEAAPGRANRLSLPHQGNAEEAAPGRAIRLRG